MNTLERRIAKLERMLMYEESDSINYEEAIFSDDIKEVKAAIPHIPNLDYVNRKIPLVEAIRKGSKAIPIVKLLLAKGADPCTYLSDRYSPMLVAIEVGNEQAIKLLLKADPDAAFKGTHTNSMPIVKYLDSGFKDKEILNALLSTRAIQWLPSIAVAISHIVWDYINGGRMDVDAYKMFCERFADMITTQGHIERATESGIDEANHKNTFYMIDALIAHKKFCFNDSKVIWRSKQAIEGVYDRMITLDTTSILGDKSLFYENLIWMRRYLGRPLSEINDRLNEEFVGAITKQGSDTDAIIEAVVDNNPFLLKKLREWGNYNKNSLNIASNAITQFFSNKNKDVRKELYKTIKDCNLSPTTYLLDSAIRYKDIGLIQIFAELGYWSRIRYSARYFGKKLPKSIAKFIDANDPKDDQEPKEVYRSSIGKLKNAITNDIFRDAERLIENEPELLEIKEVIEFINSPKNDDSYTARQLRRRIEDNSEEDSYDM